MLTVWISKAAVVVKSIKINILSFYATKYTFFQIYQEADL